MARTNRSMSRVVVGSGVRGAYSGVETPDTPDEPDALDAGDGGKGVGWMFGDGFVECVGLVGGFRGRAAISICLNPSENLQFARHRSACRFTLTRSIATLFKLASTRQSYISRAFVNRTLFIKVGN